MRQSSLVTSILALAFAWLTHACGQAATRTARNQRGLTYARRGFASHASTMSARGFVLVSMVRESTRGVLRASAAQPKNLGLRG